MNYHHRFADVNCQLHCVLHSPQFLFIYLLWLLWSNFCNHARKCRFHNKLFISGLHNLRYIKKKTCMFCFQIYMSWYLLKTDTKIWKFRTFSGGFILIFILFYFYLFFDIGVEKSLRKLDHFAVKRSTPLKKFIANFFLFFRC